MKRLAFLGFVGFVALAAAVVLNQWYGDADPVAAPHGAGPQGVAAPASPAVATVRTNEAGDTVIAGRAPANSEVTVFIGGSAAGTVMADERGDWVFVPQHALEPGAREVVLEAKLPDGRRVASRNATMVLVPAKN